MSIKRYYTFIVLLGLISLFGDIVYEGGRGIIPDYLGVLGASAVIVGFAGGLGEFIGYGVRLFSGILADMTGAYWAFMFIGYGLISMIPLLSFANSLVIAIILVILERIGKGIRMPSRDTVISLVGSKMRLGRAFGIHEFLDQIGATFGPLIVSILMYMSGNDYSLTFLMLLFPFSILMILLVYVYTTLKDVSIEKKTREVVSVKDRPVYIYMAAVALNVLGLIHFSLLLYRASNTLRPKGMQWIVPLLFMIIQLADAPSALIAGEFFDKIGIKSLFIPFILSPIPTLITLYKTDLLSLLIASILLGVILGAQESVYRAAIALFTSFEKRGRYYGIFNTIYGVGLLLSGSIYGYFIDFKPPMIIVLSYAFLTQILAIVILLIAQRSLKR